MVASDHPRQVKILDLKIPRIAYLDGLLVAGALASINLWVAPDDFGWLNQNPSPYLLLPILIGARFGFVSGIGAGASAVFIIVVGQVCLKIWQLALFSFPGFPLNLVGSRRWCLRRSRILQCKI